MSSTADPGGFLAIEAAFYVPDSKKESPIKQNERYYIQDTAIVVFQVENELFRVHRHFFTMHSPFFRTLFSLPQSDGQGQQKPSGDGTEMNPLLLPDVPKAQLEVLLDYFYEGVTFGNRITALSGSTGPGTAQEKRLKLLLELFYIANRYEFTSIRQEALQRIEFMRVQLGSRFSAIWSPIERLELATRFSVDEWLMPAYEELCMREDFITLDEAERIGGRKTAVIALARERYKKAKEAAAARAPPPPSTTVPPAFVFAPLPQPQRPAPAPTPAPATAQVSLSAILRNILSAPSR